MADNLKLAQGLRNLPASAREDLASRAADIERGKTVELLRRAGKEMYDNPIVNTAIGFTPVLGDIQAAGETLSALNRGAPWQETAGYAAGMLPFVPMIGKTVWHGSPHIINDKFDLSKIGTGSGGAIHGEGINLSDVKEYAERYNKGGGLYKVDLPDEQIAKMIDYDLPISQQSEEIQRIAFRNAKPLKKSVLEYQANAANLENVPKTIYDLSGREVFNALKRSGLTEKDLLEQGIPGAKYLHQKSIAKPDLESMHNYVVFSDEIPQILERNGQPLVNALRQSKEMPISDLKLNEYGEAIAKSNVGRDKNFISQNTNPISVVRLPSGEPYVLDGYHRIEQAKRAGQENIQVKELPLTDDIKQMLINDKVLGQE